LTGEGSWVGDVALQEVGLVGVGGGLLTCGEVILRLCCDRGLSVRGLRL
jgi:hypothetical protein